MKKALVIIITLIVIGSIYDFTTSKNGIKTSLAPNSIITHNKFKAFRYAKKEVKKHLKSPSTAKFETERIEIDNQIQRSGNSYYINSYVNSQNSFGAMLKVNFTCKVIFVNNTVLVNDIVINDIH